MPTTGLSFEQLIAFKTRAEVRAALSAARFPLSLPQAQQLTSRLEELEPPTHTLRLGIVHTYTSELLDPWLGLAASVQGLALEVYHAPYGVTVQEAREDSGLVTHRPDVTLFLLRRDDLHPRLARPLVGLAPRDQEVLREEVMTRFSHMIGQFRRFKIGRLAVSLLPAAAPLGLGMYDSMSDRSENTWWATLKADIGQFLRRSVKSSVFLDLDDAAMECGRAAFFDRRLWYSARFPFAPEAAREVARRVLAIGALAKLPTAKVLVLDGDNTLWGGILGEDGFEGIALGPDYPGNAFMDFQRRLLDFQQRGFILALCSKNNEADVDQVLKDHPHQVLRDEHFAARRVNWIPKPDNLISLAEELNLGLDSFIFVDDSDHECAAVRHRLPQVEVIQTPARPTDVPGCLDRVARLEVLLLTEEDLTRPRCTSKNGDGGR